MCFTPLISIIIAIFEFLVAIIVLSVYKENKTSKILAVFMFVLGFYQFTQFMVCKTSYSNLWSTIGFVTYSFLPAIGVYLVNIFVKKIKNPRNLFIAPIIVTFYTIINHDFIKSVSCNKYFISVSTYVFTPENYIYKWVYMIYYFGFIALCIYYLIQYIREEKDSIKRKMALILLIALITSLLPAIILLFIIPGLRSGFPSIYCEFSVIFTISTLYIAKLESKLNKKL